MLQRCHYLLRWPVRDITIFIFLLSYRAINCNLSHDREAGKLHVEKTAMPDNKIHVGRIKTLDSKFKYLFYCTFFYFALNGTYLERLTGSAIP